MLGADAMLCGFFNTDSKALIVGIGKEGSRSPRDSACAITHVLVVACLSAL